MCEEEVQSRKLQLPSSFRTCFVPLCRNNSVNSPSKVFIHVPNNPKRKKLWFNLARRADNPSNSQFFCCEDHFNLKEDMKNYTRFSLFGAPMKIKKDTVPRFFDCQPDRSRAAKHPLRKAVRKLKHKRMIEEIMLEAEKSQNKSQQLDDAVEVSIANCSTVSCSSVKISDVSSCSFSHEEVSDAPCNENSKEDIYGNVSKKPRVLQKIEKEVAKKSNIKLANKNSLPLNNLEQLDSDLSNYITTETPTTKTGSEYNPSSGELRESEEFDLHLKRDALNLTMYFISKDSKRYIGVPEEWLWIIEHLHIASNISTDDIKLTLMKIKLNDTFVRLGNQFGISSTKASTIFNTSVIKLATLLKTLIYFPEKRRVQQVMPIPFRANYSDVQSIVDGFEIQIEKPTDPVHQALTWSEYKKCNTLKYLVSCTPDGTINFISGGYGGRISDTKLFEICGIMDVLPAKCTVMADRGFKQIETILAVKNCKLVRPPSVSSNNMLSKEETRETKRIASLRIHIARVIRRIREFELLVPHACLNHCIMPYIDSTVIIAAALCNLQSPIIKT